MIPLQTIALVNKEVEKAIGEEKKVEKICLCIRSIDRYSKLFHTPPSDIHSVPIVATCGTVRMFFWHLVFVLSLQYEIF